MLSLRTNRRRLLYLLRLPSAVTLMELEIIYPVLDGHPDLIDSLLEYGLFRTVGG